MADAAGWAACAPPCTRTATHRILAPHAERMLRSPPCARLTSRILANARHREAEPAVPALEGGRPDKSASGEDARAKLATERLNPQLTVGLILPVPASHRNLGVSPKTAGPDVPGTLDMEKAFDRVSWRFLKRALTALRFTDRYTSWINMLYSDKYAPSRRVYTNGKLSEPYHIHVGTAQGCPLSPLLFLPIMEAFTRLVKADKELEGIRIGSNEYRIRHFADDTFGLLRNEHQIPRFSELIDVFCKGTNMRENEST